MPRCSVIMTLMMSIFAVFTSDVIVGQTKVAGLPSTDSRNLSTVSIANVVVERGSEKWTVNLDVNNTGESTSFICSDPQTADGAKSPYISVNNQNDQLDLAIRFYGRPNFFLAMNATDIKLVEVKAHQTLRLQFELPLPITRTFPPYEHGSHDHSAEIQVSRLNSIRITLGFVNSDPGVRDIMLPNKKFPYFNGRFTGGETVRIGENAGKRLLELQHLTSFVYTLS